MFAPKGEKELFRAIQAQNVAQMEAVSQNHPEYALAAAAIAGLLQLGAGEEERAQQLLRWVFDAGSDPAENAFIKKYVTASFRLQIAPGAMAELTLDRSAVGLALAELCQDAGNVDEAIDIVEQLEPTTFAAVSLAELYSETERYADVVALTDGITNDDDLSALLCIFRGIALREQGLHEAARAALKEALKSKKRDAVVRHRALFERARTYEVEGKRGMAKKDLERIMAEDSTYDGLADALAALAE